MGRSPKLTEFSFDELQKEVEARRQEEREEFEHEERVTNAKDLVGLKLFAVPFQGWKFLEAADAAYATSSTRDIIEEFIGGSGSGEVLAVLPAIQIESLADLPDFSKLRLNRHAENVVLADDDDISYSMSGFDDKWHSEEITIADFLAVRDEARKLLADQKKPKRSKKSK